ncbi:MAG: amidohydrolase [Mesorhizobium sp.]
MNNPDEFISTSVDDLQPRIWGAASDIWKFAELGFKEGRSADRLIAELEADGFRIERGLADMPTSFIATAGSQDGPVIAILAEYDALPEMSQEAVAYQKRREGQVHGHACGHHIFGAAAMGAGLALKRWIDATGAKAQIRVYGTPAEEGGAGKTFMVRAGLFDDVDICLHWHPAAYNMTWSSPCLAMVAGKFDFSGRAAHAAGYPELGRSALKAVEAMNVMVNMMREHIPSDARIHYTIDHGGAAPNIVPDFAQAYYMVRHPNAKVTLELLERVKKAAEGAAIGTETSFEFRQRIGHYDMLPNVVLGELVHRVQHEVGGVTLDAEETEFAQEIQKTLVGNIPPLASLEDILPFDANHMVSGSTDVGDISWVVPTVGFFASTWVPGTLAHSWQATAAGGTGIASKGGIVAAKVLALTALNLIRNPDLIVAARDEFEKRRGEGFVYKSLMEDIGTPDLNYWNNA